MANYKQAWLDAEELLRNVTAERDRLREALEKLANPTHQPKGEEANLLQMEVQQIAREALSRPENERG